MNVVNDAIIYDNLYFHQVISNVFCLRKNLVSTNIPGKFSIFITKQYKYLTSMKTNNKNCFIEKKSLKTYTNVLNQRKDEELLRVFFRSTTKLCCNNYLIKISRRSMLSRAAYAVAKTSSEMTPIVAQEIQKNYSTLVMTDQISEQDSSTTNHPIGVEISCATENCHEINCAKNNSNCDPCTQKAEIAFHITHSLKGVESYKITTKLDTFGEKEVHAIIHEEKEIVKHAYDKYRYQDSMMVQDDNNTKKLQEALKQQEEEDNHEQQ